MSSGDFFNHNSGQRSMPLQGSYRSPLAGILADPNSPISLRRPDLIGKRSLAEFQQHQQLQQQAAILLRNVKPRPFNMEFSNTSSFSSVSNASSFASLSSVPRYGVPVMRHPSGQSFNGVMGASNNSCQHSKETEGKMMRRLQELEKELLLDDDEENDVVSEVTNSEWSETIQNILGTTPFSPSPTSSSSSSCASSSASPTTFCPKQLLSDAAVSITDGKPDAAIEILTRLAHISNARGTPEQRLSFYVSNALRARLRVNPTTAAELYGKEHILSTQLLHDKSPCFKLALMAANTTIIELGQANRKLHVVDFDIGQGVQYVYLLHALAAARVAEKQTPFSLKLTTFTDFGNGGTERLSIVGDGLQSLANKLGVCFSFYISTLKLSDLNTTSLRVENDDVLTVNLAFKLYKLPDESVTTENLRDELLRRVKGLSPALVTVVEQELNANTASFETRVSQTCGYYGALLESLDATIPRDQLERVKIEEGLGRKMVNSVACEGRERVERCEVFGKWRARMGMAGFEASLVSRLSAESMVKKVNSGTRVKPGFTLKEEAGGIGFGWMGRTLTVASAWY